MKVSLIIGAFYPASIFGGPIFSTLYLSRKLARAGINVNVVTTNANYNGMLDVETNKYIKFEENLFVKYYGSATSKCFSWPMILNMWRDIRRSDIVFLQPVFPAYVAAALFYARLFKKPVLLSPRGCLMPWSLQSGSRFKKLWLRLFVRPFVDYISWHATSKAEEKAIKSLYKRARIYCMPNGINRESYTACNLLTAAEVIRRYTQSEVDGKCIIASMGRLHKVKGFDVLIDAFKQIEDEVPDAVLLIAGQDAGERANLLTQIKKANLETRVFLVGQLSGQDKIDFLSNADLFVLPSHNENFGVVYAEALAAGTPVIASRNTPWSAVEHHKCGRWVENTSGEVSKAIVSILNSDYKQMGENGRRYVFDAYEWEEIAKGFINTFNCIRRKDNPATAALCSNSATENIA